MRNRYLLERPCESRKHLEPGEVSDVPSRRWLRAASAWRPLLLRSRSAYRSLPLSRLTLITLYLPLVLPLPLLAPAPMQALAARRSPLGLALVLALPEREVCLDSDGIPRQPPRSVQLFYVGLARLAWPETGRSFPGQHQSWNERLLRHGPTTGCPFCCPKRVARFEDF